MFFFFDHKLFNYISICNISFGLLLVLRRLFRQDVRYMNNNMPINFSLFYSTETGNSRKISELFKTLLDEAGIEAHVFEINSIFDENINLYKKNSVIAFVISTCGNGSFPSSSRKYIRYLSKMKRSGNEIFSGIKYTVIGLGSSVYEYSFNSAAIKLDKFITSLGGEKLCEIALLDEINGNEVDFIRWWNNTFLKRPEISELKKKSNLFNKIEVVKKNDFICKLKNVNENSTHSHIVSGNCHISENYFKLLEFQPINRVLLCESKAIDGINRQIFNLQLKPPDHINYRTFDIIDILPPNQDESIIFFSNKVLGINNIEDLKNTIVEFAPVNEVIRKINVPFPNNCSLLHILRYYFDLLTLPPYFAMQQFVPYLSPNERNLISNEDFFNENKDLYKFSFDLFIDNFMKSLKPIPFERFVGFSGLRQNLRSYSISSSSSCSPSIIDLTVSTCIKGYVPTKLYKTNSSKWDKRDIKNYFKGLCSNFLFEFDLNLPVFGMIRPSSLNVKDVTSPVLMFSHGSGIAPIRALLHERKHILTTKKKSKSQAYLFYGCRTKDEIIYEDEIENFKKTGALTEVFFAFSKSQKKHVNDIISLYVDQVLEVVDKNDSIIYICGKKDFVSGIKDEIASIISIYRSKVAIKDMFIEGRVFIESWN